MTQHAPSAQSKPQNQPQSRQAAIYAAVLERYLSEDLSVGSRRQLGTVYLLTTRGADQGSGGGAKAKLSVRVQRSLSSTLREDKGHYRVRWVEHAAQVKLTGRLDCDPAGKRDVLVKLGHVATHHQRITVTLDGLADCGLVGGEVYRLRAGRDSWVVTGHQLSWQA